MRRTTKQSARAWFLIPAVIAVAVVIGVLVSSYQKEAGLMDPSPWGRTAVAAAYEARELSVGNTDADYSVFSRALLVAIVAHKNAPTLNAADTRLSHILAQALDCLKALREAWQADLTLSWDDETYGSPQYWNTLHPALSIMAADPLSPDAVRRQCRQHATELLEEAADLAG